MDVTKGSASAAPIYEDFVPTSNVVSDEDCDTLLIHLPGFKKEQLRVQLTKGILKISGSIPIGDNKMKRFQKEFPVSPNCDTNKITARFEGGVLHVKQPKLITPVTTSIKPEQHKLPSPPRQPTPPRSPATQELKKPTHNGAEEATGNKMDKLPRNEAKIEAKTDGERKDKGASGKEEAGVNTRIENYRKMAGAMGERLKMQRRVLHVVLASFFACIVAIYVNNLINSSKQPKT